MPRHELGRAIARAVGARRHRQTRLPAFQIERQGGHRRVSRRLVRRDRLSDDSIQVVVVSVAADQSQDPPQGIDVVGDRRRRAVPALGTGEIPRHRPSFALSPAFIGQQARDAEVEQTHAALRVEHDVRRLEIGVRHQSTVRVLHYARHSAEHVDALKQGQVAHRVVQRRALDVVHDQIGSPRLGHAPVCQPDDVGMIELRQYPSLGLEGDRGGGPQLIVQQFDRDALLEQAVVALAAPDLSHAARPDLRGQAKRAYALGRFQRRRDVSSRQYRRHGGARGVTRLEPRQARQNIRAFAFEQSRPQSRIVRILAQPPEQVEGAQFDLSRDGHQDRR